MTSADSELPEALIEVLEGLSDQSFAGRLRHLYEAAARAIFRLGDMDLVKYETTVVDGSPDLSLWEEMAPVIRDTVMDVNALLTVIREQFPAHPPGGIGDVLTQAIEEAGPLPKESARARRIHEAEETIQAICQQLAQEITHLGERMRSPSVVSDRWNLLADIQSFRSKFRDLISELVYSTATAFRDVHREDVVPGHAEDVTASVAIRSTVTDLVRLLGARLKDVGNAEPEDIQWHAQQLERELDAFGRTAAYRALRAQDKRHIIEFRHTLGRLAVQATLVKKELLEILRPFIEFIGSLNRVNNRELLIAHDREVWAGCGVKLERAEQLLASDFGAAAEALAEAAQDAQELYGREAALDVFLRKARKISLAALDEGQLKQELNNFRELLANLPML